MLPLLTAASLEFQIATTQPRPRMDFSIPATDGYPTGMPPTHPLQDLPGGAQFAGVSGQIAAHAVLPNPGGDAMLSVPIWWMVPYEN